GDEDPLSVRVRVVNAADSTGAQFYVSWAGDSGQIERPNETAVYVPPGQSRVVRLPRAAKARNADRIVLRGDDHDFDNTVFVVPLRRDNVAILYARADGSDDPRGMLHYLRLAMAHHPL